MACRRGDPQGLLLTLPRQRLCLRIPAGPANLDHFIENPVYLLVGRRPAGNKREQVRVRLRPERLDRLLEATAILHGEGDAEVSLRKNDYLQALAESLNKLGNNMRRRQNELTELARKLEEIKDELEKSGSLSDDARTAMEEAIRVLREYRRAEEPTASS